MTNTLSAGQMKLIMNSLTNSIPAKDLTSDDAACLIGQRGLLGEKIRLFWRNILDELHDTYKVRGAGIIETALLENELTFSLDSKSPISKYDFDQGVKEKLYTIPQQKWVTFKVLGINSAVPRNIRHKLTRLGYRSATLTELIAFTIAEPDAVYGRPVSIFDRNSTFSDMYWVHAFTPDSPEGPTQICFLNQEDAEGENCAMTVLCVKL